MKRLFIAGIIASCIAWYSTVTSSCLSSPYQANNAVQKATSGMDWGTVLPWVIVVVLGIIIMILLKSKKGGGS